MWALLDAGASEVRVWNRTPERARRLCAELGGVAVLSAAPADLLVHCTASGLNEPRSMFNSLPIGADDVVTYSCVVDLVYRKGDTPLVSAARAHAIHTVDGLDVLMAQGALSFECFTGGPAPIEAMHAALRRE